MSILEINVQDVEELAAVPEGEYELVIEELEVRKSAKGMDMLVARLSIEGEDNAKQVFDYMILPGQYDEPTKNQGAARKIKRFCQAFNLPLVDLDLESAVGARGWAILSEEEYVGEMNNKIRRYIGK